MKNKFTNRLKTVLIICIGVFYNEMNAQVSVTAPSLTVTACPSFPTNVGTLDDIVIAESQPNDISGSGTLILACPGTFIFGSPGTPTGNTTDVGGFGVSYTNTSITISFTVTDSTQLDTIKLSGVQVVGILNPNAGNIINAGGTAIIKGDTVGLIHAVLTSSGMPSLISSLTPPPLCSGGVFNYTPLSSVAGTSFAWTRAAVTGISDTATSGAGNPMETLTDTTLGSVNVTYEYTLMANGCTNPSTYSVVVAVHPAPVLISADSIVAVCSGIPVEYTPQSSIPGTTFAWSRAAVVGISDTAYTGNDTIHEILTDTLNTSVDVTYIYTLSANGCTSPVMYNVVATVNPAPIITSTDSVVLCTGDTLVLPITTTMPATYLWVASDNNYITGESITPQIVDTINNILINDTTVLQIASYTITPTAVLNGCVGQVQNLRVSVLPVPVVIVSDTVMVCSGSGLAIPLMSNVVAYYTWSALDNPIILGEHLTDVVADTLNDTLVNTSDTLQTVVYTVTANSFQGGCIGSPKTLTVLVNPKPVITSSSKDTICSGEEVTVALSSNILSAYSWVAIDNPNTTGESITIQTTDTIQNSITNLTDTLQTVVYTVTPVSTNGSCTGSVDTITITVHPQPVANAGNDIVLCAGLSDTLGSVVVQGRSYLWNPSLNISDTAVSNPIVVATNNSDSSVTTTYILTEIVVATGCLAWDSVVVTANPQPVLVITHPDTVCAPNIIDLTDSLITAGSTGGGVFTYWTNALATDTLQMPTAVSVSDTNYIKVTALGGCTDIDSVITVVKPTPVINAGSDVVFCSGFSDTIGLAADALYTYLWWPAAGLSDSTVSNPVTTGVNTTVQPISTSYILKATHIVSGCDAIDTVMVTINPQPVLVVIPPPVSCASDTIDFTDSAFTAGSTQGGIYTYWTDSALTDTLHHPESVSQSGTYFIKLIEQGGCTDTQSVTLVLNPLPMVSFTGLNYSNCFNAAPQVLTGSPPGGVFSGFGMVADTFTAANAGVGVQAIIYTYTDTNGCSRSATQIVEIIALSNITPELCYVTVDTASQHNLIYWDKTLYATNVDSFIVYREILPDSFARVGAVPKTLGVLKDTVAQQYAPDTGNPNTSDYKYKLQVRDTCGTYSVLSSYHKTMYLTRTGNTFNWTHYNVENEAVPLPEITSYVLERDGNATGNWDVVASAPASQTSITDPNFSSYPSGRWRISTLWSITCATPPVLTASYSNMIISIPPIIGVSEINEFIWPLSIYPNPYLQSTTIRYTLNRAEDVTIEAYNTLGQKIETIVNEKHQAAGEYRYQFGAKKQGYSGGIYFIKITISGKSVLKRVVETE